MEKVYLDSNKSVVCEIDGDKVKITATHSNQKNAQLIAENLTSMVGVERKNGSTFVSVNGIPFARVASDGYVEQKNALTTFETRVLGMSKDRNNIEKIPFDRFEKETPVLATDLHTHLPGHLSPEKLIECGLGRNAVFSEHQLEVARIDTTCLNMVRDFKGNVWYFLEDIIEVEGNYDKLVRAMKIGESEQDTFNKMEDAYDVRYPLTKNPETFIPMIKEIAKDCQANGVKYIELSVASVISNVKQLKQLEVEMPYIEAETGVKVRFLGALWRHSDKEWNQDEVDRLKVAAKSPYVVGLDVMGHESNSTEYFYDEIKECAKYAMQYDPDFVLRVHAGENAIFKANVRQVFLAVEEAKYELEKETGKKFDYPQVRIGHGIYGFDEPAPWDEKERTKGISTSELCKEINPIIEFNMSSNLALNNINGISEIPIKKYVDLGIRVVLGTDGKGMYSTDLSQEAVLAKQAGLTEEDFNTILQTEKKVMERAERRFEERKFNKADDIAKEMETCYRNGERAWNDEVEEKYKTERAKLQAMLGETIKKSGAETNHKKILEATKGKHPIMISGSSLKHWPQVSEENQFKVAVLMDTLVHCIDTDKAIFITGGTDYGVEAQLHKYANKYNKTENGKLVVLGTLTEEAMYYENNQILPNTITHAMIPSVYGRPAKKWFDLPDAVFGMVEKNKGAVVAVGGGPVVGDIIQRAYNTGLDLNIMSGIEGASGEKSKALAGMGYDFADAVELVLKLQQGNRELMRADLTREDIERIVKESTERVEKEKEIERNKALNANNQQELKQEEQERVDTTELSQEPEDVDLVNFYPVEEEPEIVRFEQNQTDDRSM